MNPEIRVCVPVCADSLDLLRDMSQRAVEWADLIELRLDCLSADELKTFSEAETKFTSHFSRPLILTLRDPAQGGWNSWSKGDREEFWRKQLRNPVGLFDLELDLVQELDVRDDTVDWSRCICSYHDFEGVPENLERIFDRLLATPARIIKIAVAAHDVVDTLSIFRLLGRGQQQHREVIAIAMGNAGVVTRILGPSRGAYLTYGASNEEGATAAGQLTARDLRSTYRIKSIDRATMVTGLVGMPAMHSVSPEMHNAAFSAEKLNGVYIPFEVSDLSSFVDRMVHPLTRELDWNLRGLSITAPHKTSIMQFLDWIEPDAIEIGAVNTVVIDGNRLLGYNTDAKGFLKALTEKMQKLANSRIAVIGGGGVANAVIWALKRSGANVTLYVRNPVKGQSLAERFAIECHSLEGAIFNGHDVVVNTTPLGAVGTHSLDTPALASQLKGVPLLYDLIYNPLDTPLMRHARQAGCETLDGLSMLVNQAVSQFSLWTGKSTSNSIMHDAAIAKLTFNE